MEKAIKRSIEGGYLIHGIILEKGQLFAFGRPDQKAVENLCCIDPLFWQALGKAEGWGEQVCNYCGKDCARTFEEDSNCCNEKISEGWKLWWHNFIDHLAEGGTADDFFNNLIK